jgi:F-type H+-transporting ATPase subunit b
MIWFLLSAAAWASEGGHGEAAAHAAHDAHAIPWSSIFVQSFNLGFLLILLFVLLRKTVVAHFANRAAEYQLLVSRAETARIEAEKGRKAVKDRLTKLEAENTQVVSRARAEAEDLKTRMVQEAKAVALRMEQEAQRTVKAEVEKAKTELRRELLEKAINSSRQNLNNLSTGDQQKLQREFADKIQVVGQ